MLKIIFILGFLSLAWGDHYHPHDIHFPAKNKPIKVEKDETLIENRFRRHIFHLENNQVKAGEKIIGGEQTTIEKFPYQASLRYITVHVCGASIVDENTAITAAHCVYGKSPSSMTLLSGTAYLNDYVTHPGKLSFLKKIIVHEDYSTKTQDNDVAILKLLFPLSFNDKIKPIALQDVGNVIAPSTQVVVSGWGRTKEGTPVPPGANVLRKVTLSVISFESCNSRYGGELTKSMICAQAPGRDSCQGDSGGPLVANNKLVGIVSWGYGCARPQYPGVYTSIAVVRSWIETHRND